jgi:ankyrin repeat protein
MSAHTPTDLLFAAIAAKDISAIKASIAAGADLHSEKTNGIPLTTMADTNFGVSAQIYSILLQAGCQTVTVAALHKAVETMDIDILRQILDIVPAGENLEDEETYTPLMSAARIGRPDMCRLLIERGGNPKAYDEAGRGLFHHALSEPINHSSGSIIEIVKLLLEASAPLNLRSGADKCSLLLNMTIELCLDNQQFVDDGLGVKLFELLIHSASLKKIDINLDATLYHVAKTYSSADGGFVFDPQLIPFLVKNGANVNVKALAGESPLHHAASAGNISAILGFLAHGADIDAVDDYGRSALHLARNVSTASILLESGINASLHCTLGGPAEDYLASPLLFRQNIHAFLKSIREQAALERSTSNKAIPRSPKRV